MQLKADPTAKDKFGNTPFNDAVRAKHDDVVAIMKVIDQMHPAIFCIRQSFVELHPFIWDCLDFSSECVCCCAMMQKFDPDISFKLPGNELGVQMCQVTIWRAFFTFSRLSWQDVLLFQAAYSGKLEDIKRLVKNGGKTSYFIM